MRRDAILKGEFIGKEVKIIYNDKQINGTIIDETKNMLYVETSNGIKKIIKQHAKIEIDTIKFNGNQIIKRPEDRIKV